jgi:hypothetical protein
MALSMDSTFAAHEGRVHGTATRKLVSMVKVKSMDLPREAIGSSIHLTGEGRVHRG